VAGELDLEALLGEMKPELREGIFVFCTIADDTEIPSAIRPLLTFREREGTTLVMRRGGRSYGAVPPIRVASDHFDSSFLA